MVEVKVKQISWGGGGGKQSVTVVPRMMTHLGKPPAIMRGSAGIMIVMVGISKIMSH